MNYGVDRYKRPYPISAHMEQARQKEREEYLQRQVNDLWRTIPADEQKKNQQKQFRFPDEPQENLLYFFENTPLVGALAARSGAHSVQNCPVFLSAAANPGNE